MSRARHARPPKRRARKIALGAVLPGMLAVSWTAPASSSPAGITVMAFRHPPVSPVSDDTAADGIIVQPGDTLSGIAARYCGNPADWTGIYDGNSKVIGADWNLIISGESLVLDCTTGKLPELPAQPAAPAASGIFSFSGLEALWEKAGGPSWAAAEMATIAERCESGGNPRAYNSSSTASGLWQILGLPFPGDPFDPETNAAMAVAKFKDAGDSYAPWSGDGCV
jgi:hypothetical protein